MNLVTTFYRLTSAKLSGHISGATVNIYKISIERQISHIQCYCKCLVFTSAAGENFYSCVLPKGRQTLVKRSKSAKMARWCQSLEEHGGGAKSFGGTLVDLKRCQIMFWRTENPSKVAKSNFGGPLKSCQIILEVPNQNLEDRPEVWRCQIIFGGAKSL